MEDKTRRRRWTIYALLDPRSGQERYIGCTSLDPYARMTKHLDTCHRGTSARALWLQRLRDLGLRPLIRVLDYANDKTEAMGRERWYIEAHCRAGFALTNMGHDMHHQLTRYERENYNMLRARANIAR